jgi:hydroxymethylglutaryl-CoA lyase
VLTALPFGIRTFDASAGGLGGCPYAPGAAGNLATDDLVYLLDGLGIETGVSLAGLSEASAFIGSRIDHPLPSKYAQAWLAGRK